MRARLIAVGMMLALAAAAPAAAAELSPWKQPAYRPVDRSMEAQTVTLTGHDLTIEQLVAIARHGAKVRLSPEAKARQADQYGLLLEAPVEGVSVYWYTRGAGAARETVMFDGDPLRADNKAYLEQNQLQQYQNGVRAGEGPEVGEEEVVRAMMAARANAMVYDGPSPQLSEMLIELINRQVTPVVRSLGSTGEADVSQLQNVGAAMVGVGEAYYRGQRMSAAEALKQAGLKPLQPFAADVNVLTSSDAFSTGGAALLVADARAMLDWADVIYAMDLNGMNGSITPITHPAQSYRAFPWLKWDAERVKEMIRGSYLFSGEYRIIQDPESLRASYIRQGAAWQAWATLRRTILAQLNTSDHSPAVRVGMKPTDSWELSTPQMMKYYVKGGPRSNGKGGYIISNANFDPQPIGNDVEALSNAVANMAVAVTQRHGRFTNPFFTVVRANEVLTPEQVAQSRAFGNQEWTIAGLYQQLQALVPPVTPEGIVQIGNVEDLQGQTPLKVDRARQVVDFAYSLLAYDLTSAALWLDIRKIQEPKRDFGPAATAGWRAFRKAWPLFQDPATRPTEPTGAVGFRFMKATPVASFYSGGPPMPETDAQALAAINSGHD